MRKVNEQVSHHNEVGGPEQEQKEDKKATNEKEKHECHGEEGSPESG